jgi:hypothetical protein
MAKNNNNIIPILRLDDFAEIDDMYTALPSNNKPKKIINKSDYINCFICSYYTDHSCCFDMCIIESYTAQITLPTTQKIEPRKNVQIKQINWCGLVCLFAI